MTLKVRRILSSIFIVLFIIMTPVIMLYAAGYKIGKNGFSIQKTGMFIIASKPSGAKISINGQAQKTWAGFIFGKKKFISTPAKVKNLLPGEYDVEIELDGYWVWRKKLTISPGASTFAENIYLFRNDLPTQIIQSDPKSAFLSPGGKQAAAAFADEIVFINLAQESEKKIRIKNGAEKNAVWSEDGNQIIFGDSLYDLADPVKPSAKQMPLTARGYQWDGDILRFRDQNSIYELVSGNSPKIITQNKIFSDYLAKNGVLYLIVQSEKSSDIQALEIGSGKKIKNINLPRSENYSFMHHERNMLNVHDKNRKILYLINPLSDYQPLAEIINNVKTAFWADETHLVYANDFEIWLYDAETKNKILITRISEEIKKAVMHAGKNYVVYSTAKSINAVELDQREKRNAIELVKFDFIESFELAEDEIIYFTGKIGNSQGLYKFLIQ